MFTIIDKWLFLDEHSHIRITPVYGRRYDPVGNITVHIPKRHPCMVGDMIMLVISLFIYQRKIYVRFSSYSEASTSEWL